MNARHILGFAFALFATACGSGGSSMTIEDVKALRAKLQLDRFDLCPPTATSNELESCFRGAIAKRQYKELVSYCGENVKTDPERLLPPCRTHAVAAAMLDSRIEIGTKYARDVCDIYADDALFRVDYVTEISVVAVRALSERSSEEVKKHQSFVVERTLAHADICKVPRKAVVALMKEQGAELKAKGAVSAKCATTPACLEALEAGKP